MKAQIGVDIGTYTFDASAKTVTISGVSSLTLDQILGVINVKQGDNTAIYRPITLGLGGTIAGNVITLEYNTTSMSDTDELAVFVSLPTTEVPTTTTPATGVINKVSFADTPNLDAFGRLRVSQLDTQFDGKQLHDALPLFYDIETIGTGNDSHSTANAETTMTTVASADAVIMQTKQRFNYRSGKSALGLETFRNFDTETNITKRVGYFNSNIATPFASDYDGFYLENANGTINFVINKTGAPNTTVQSAWNGDKVDGTGASGVDLELGTDAGNLLLWYQFEWLGVGAVTFGFVVNNEFIVCHREDHIMGDGVYMSSPNHSLRYEIRQTGAGSGTFRSICSTFSTEGALNAIGKDGGISDDGTHLDANSTASWYVAVALRLNSAKLDTLVDVLDATLKSDTNDDFEFRVVLNPTYNGTLTYNTITNYACEYALGATANTVTADEAILKAGYGVSNDRLELDLQTALRLGATIAGVVDEIAIIVKPHSSNLDIHRAINWRELT